VLARRHWHATPAIVISLVDVLLVIVFGIVTPQHAFVRLSDFQDMALDSAQITLLTVGAAFLLGAAELDISLGANVILSSVIGSKLLLAAAGPESDAVVDRYPHLTLGIAIGVLSCLLFGAVVGLVNGLIVTRLKVGSFITTLAMLGILTGFALILTGGANVPNLPSSIQQNFGVKDVLNVPLPALVSAMLIAVLWWFFARTRFGLYVRAVGSSREAAIRAGLPVNRHLVLIFVIVGVLCGVSGCLDVSRFATTDVSGHTSDALSAIAGAVIGGTGLYGGKVSVGGAIAGSFLAEILQTGLIIAGVPSFYQLVVIGVILIVAVALRQRNFSLRRAFAPRQGARRIDSRFNAPSNPN
jgi:ribose transport system permease protein